MTCTLTALAAFLTGVVSAFALGRVSRRRVRSSAFRPGGVPASAVRFPDLDRAATKAILVAPWSDSRTGRN